jgi:gamma-glutamyltranspeptidase
MVPGTGLLAACVPGAFDAWMQLLRDHGTLALSDVFEVAIGLAENGFPVIAPLAEVIASMEQFFVEHWPSSAETYPRRRCSNSRRTAAQPNARRDLPPDPVGGVPREFGPRDADRRSAEVLL